MKYPKGTFWKNLEAAKKFGDDEMVMDLIADQTTDIALVHPDALNAALEHAGIKVDKSNIDPKYLIGLVADNLHTSPKLIQNLSLMISDLNTPNRAEGGSYLHEEGGGGGAPAGGSDGGGDDSKGGGKMTGGQTAGLVTGILSTVGSLAGTVTGAITGGKIEKEKNKGKMFDYLSAKENAKATLAKETAAAKAAVASNKTMLTIGLAIVVVGGLGFALYMMNKNTDATVASIVPVVK